MCHVLQDPAFFHFLTRIDEEFAAATRVGRCPGCEGPLHVADYPRKPRGCPAAVREDFPRTSFWQSVRERFMPPVVIAQLPQSLLDRFDAGEMTDRLTQALRFIAPLSTRAMTK